MPESYPFEPESTTGAPPILNNMGGLNPHGNKNPSKKALSGNWCGLDWLTLTLSIDWGANWGTDAAKEKNWTGEGTVPTSKQFDGIQIREILDRAQLEAMAKGDAIEVAELDGAKIHPGGGKIAKKYCRFKIELESAVILIADQPAYRGDWPNVKVEITGNHCLCYHGGALEAYKDAVNWLENIGASIHKERVSRVDICADFPGWAMWRFIPWAMNGRYTCRSRLFHPYLKPNGTSLYWGSTALILRIYDKLGEMKEKALRGEPAKYQHMIEKRWGGVEPKRAIRVEFQLRRESLKGFGITDFDSLAENNGDLVRYLVGGDGATLEKWKPSKNCFEIQKNARWFRFLKKKPDNKHPERNTVYPRWKKVQDVFCKNFLCPEVMKEIKPEESNIETLLKQAFGVLTTAASNRGYDVPGKDSFAPKKYRFNDYAAFEKWMVLHLRSIAIQKEGWEFDRPEREQDSIDIELEDMRMAAWKPNPEVLKMNRLEKAIDDEREAGLIGG